MKRLFYFIMIWGLLLTSVLSEAKPLFNQDEQSYLRAKKSLRVYVEPNVFDYTYTYENHLNGYAIHYIRQLAKKLDVDIQFLTHLTPLEAKEALILGQIDLALFATFDASYERTLAKSTEAIGVLQPALLVPKIYQISPTLESLEKRQMVTLNDDPSYAIIKAKNPDAMIQTVSSIEEVVDKVLSQEVDFAIGTHELFMAQLELKHVTTLQSIPLRHHTLFPMTPLFIFTSQENFTLLSALNKAMGAMEFKELLFAKNRFFALKTLHQTRINKALLEDEKFFLMRKQMLRACTMPNHMPYGAILNHHYEGIGAEVISFLETALDTPIEILPTHSKEQTLQRLLDKQCDFSVMATPMNISNNALVSTTSFLDVPLVLLTKDDQGFVPDLKRILNRSFVMQKDHPMLEAVQQAYPSIHLTLVDSEIEGLRLIEEGRHYGYITSHFAVSYLFHRHLADRLKVTAQLPLSMPFSFVTHKDTSLGALFTLLEHFSSGTLQDQLPLFIQKWVPDRFPKGFDYQVVLEFVFFFTVFAVIVFMLYFEVRLKKSRLETVTHSLDTLNRELETRVLQEVKQNREKDMIMYRQSRFASMGEMIGNIAHQWRQPLMELSSLLMDLQATIHFKKRLSNDEALQTIKASNHVIHFMSETIDDFRNFFSPQKEYTYFGVNEVVKEAVSIMKATLHHHGIVVNITEQIAHSMAYGLKNEYAQVIINIISNSKDTILSRGITEGIIEIVIEEEEKVSKVRIFDNAGGIKHEYLPYIFEPFFTKGKSNGTGIGLFMSRMIIENTMKGSINACNSDKGALFEISVPKYENTEH